MDSNSSPTAPATPRWNSDRPFLTGRFHQEIKESSLSSEIKGFSMDSLSLGAEKAIGCYHASVQGVRAANLKGTAISRSSLLCRSMLKFINNLLHYLTFEVLEPNWHVMNNKLQSAKSIDEVIQYHDLFLQKCLRECMLLLPVLLKKMEKLKLICLQYAAATQWLISSSIEVAEPLSSSGEDSKVRFSSKALKFTENATVTDSILKFEKVFNAELHSLGPILSSRSQAEPYLTHLAQWILGVGNEQ